MLYVHDGKPAYCYNLLGVQQFRVYGDTPLPAGDHQVRMEFAYDDGGLGLGGEVSPFLDGTAIGTGRVAATQPMIFSADETIDLGNDSATPVCDDIRHPHQHLRRPCPMDPDRPRRRRRRRRPPRLP